MNNLLRKATKLLLGISLAAGVGVAIGSKAAERVDAADTSYDISAAISTSYKAYTGTGFVVTYGGGGGAVGVNNNATNWTKMNLSSYSKYAVSPVTTSDYATAVVLTATTSDVIGMSFAYTGGTNANKGNIYAIYSSNNSTFSQLSITSGTSQGTQLTTTSGSATFNFAKCSGYFGIVIKSQISSGNFKYTGVTLTITREVAGEPSLSDITASANTLQVGNSTGVSLSVTPTNPGSNTVAWSATPSTGVSFSSASGNSTTITFPSGASALTGGTSVVVRATLTNSIYSETTIYAIEHTGTQNDPYNALEAKYLALNGDTGTHYVAAYIQNVTNNGYVWLSDNSSATSGDFELYGTITNNTSITLAKGQFILASGTFDKYNTTAEATSCTIHRVDVITLAHSELYVNNTQTETLSVSSAGGDVVWSTTAGTGSVTLSNQSNSSVTITGTSIGTATVTATVGTASASCFIIVREYATDWAFKDIVLEDDGTFNNTYYVNGTLDTTGLSVTYIEHSNTLNKDRETNIELEDVTFNFDSNKGNIGSFNLTATYLGHTTDDVITVNILEKPSGIGFNSTTFTSISSSVLSDSAEDSNGVTWSIGSTFSGTVSISKTAAHIQFGAKSKYADSVEVSMDLGSIKTFTSIAFKVDAFTGDTGDITMKLDGTSIATGSINGTTEVTIGPSNYVRGQVLTILIENEGALRVNLISCEYFAYTDDEMVSNFVRDYMHMSYDEGGVHGSTGGDGSCKSQGWYTTAKTNYNKLFDPQKSLFNTQSKYDAAKQRLIDWAVANDEVFNPSAYTFTANSGAKLLFTIVGTENSNTIAIIVIISMVSVTAIGGYFFIKRRKVN